MASVQFFNPLGGASYREGSSPSDHARRPFNNWQSDVAWDLVVPTRTRCFAPFDAEVVRVGSLGDSGATAGIRIGLDNGAGLAAFLHHLVSEEVFQGQRVRAGQLVGLTGIANSVPHLHFGMGRTYGDDAVANGIDPTPFLRATRGLTVAVTMSLEGGVPTPELPFGGSLRLVLGGAIHRGWDECRQPILAIATDESTPVDPCALSWRGRLFSGPPDVTNVCRNLAGRFLGLDTLAQDLSVGSRGEAVEHAEHWLRRHGFDPGPVDGVFDAATKDAVMAFQRAKNLGVDGVIGRDTWRALRR
jgi:putative peptidoglycan binding protein/peptidase M23-like protein